MLVLLELLVLLLLLYAGVQDGPHLFLPQISPPPHYHQTAQGSVVRRTLH
jgi:hypothetical protein